MGLTMPEKTSTSEGDGGVADVFGNDLGDISVWEDDPFVAASSFTVRNVVNQAIEIATNTTKESMFQTPSSAFLPPRTPGREQRKKVGMSMVVAPPRTPTSTTNSIRRRVSAGSSSMDDSGFASPTTPSRPQLRMSLTPTSVKMTKLLTSDELLQAKQRMPPKQPPQQQQQQLPKTPATATKQNLAFIVPPSPSDSPESFSPSSVVEHAFPVEWTADPLDQFVESRGLSPSPGSSTSPGPRSPRRSLNIKVVHHAPTTTTKTSTAHHSPPPPHHRRRSSSTNGERQRRRQRSLSRTTPSPPNLPPHADNNGSGGDGDGWNVDPQQSPSRTRSPLTPRAQRRGSAGGSSSPSNTKMTVRIACSSSSSSSPSHHGGRVRRTSQQGPPPRARSDFNPPKPSPMTTRTKSDPSNQSVSPRRTRTMSETADLGVEMPSNDWTSSFSRLNESMKASNNPLEEEDENEEEETTAITQKVEEGEDKDHRRRSRSSSSKRMSSLPDAARRSPSQQRHPLTTSSPLGAGSPQKPHAPKINVDVDVDASLLKPTPTTTPLWSNGGEAKQDHDAVSNIDLTPSSTSNKRPSLAGRKIKYARRNSEGDAMTAATSVNAVVATTDGGGSNNGASKASSRRGSASRSRTVAVAKEHVNVNDPPSSPSPAQENSTTITTMRMRRRSTSPAAVKMAMTTRVRSPILPPNLPPTTPKTTERAARRGSATGTKELTMMMKMKPPIMMIMSPSAVGGSGTTPNTNNNNNKAGNKLTSPSPRRKIKYIKSANVEGGGGGEDSVTPTFKSKDSITSVGAVLLALPPISMEHHTVDLRSIVMASRK